MGKTGNPRAPDPCRLSMTLWPSWGSRLTRIFPPRNKGDIVTPPFDDRQARGVDAILNYCRTWGMLPVPLIVTDILKPAPNNMAGATVSNPRTWHLRAGGGPVVLVNQGGRWMITSETAYNAVRQVEKDQARRARPVRKSVAAAILLAASLVAPATAAADPAGCVPLNGDATRLPCHRDQQAGYLLRPRRDLLVSGRCGQLSKGRQRPIWQPLQRSCACRTGKHSDYPWQLGDPPPRYRL